MPDPTTSNGASGGSLSDLASVLRNVVTAVNNASHDFLAVNGAQNFPQISSTTLVSAKSGRAARISVTTAGGTTGLLYDTNTVNSLVNPIYVIPAAVGVYDVNLPVGLGIVVVPGTSQVLTISYA